MIFGFSFPATAFIVVVVIPREAFMTSIRAIRLPSAVGYNNEMNISWIIIEWPREILSGSLAPVGLATLRKRQGQVSDGFTNAWLGQASISNDQCWWS